MERLEGRRIVLTGASRGIGAAVARTLAGLGAELVLVARGGGRLAALAAELPGGHHVTAALDVADEGAWQRLRESAFPDGPVHGLVTAAAVLGPVGPVGSWPIDAFRQTLETNLVGTLLAVTACLDGLRAARGAVVTFSGGGATAAFPRFDAYAASKAAVVRLTENLAEELADDGVRVNAVAPGFVVSSMHDGTLAAGPDAAGEEYYERTRRAVASGQGDPPEAAASLTAFLLSTESAGISGKLLSARWDPWQEAGFRRRLRCEKDLATLRRIDDQLFVAGGGGAAGGR